MRRILFVALLTLTWLPTAWTALAVDFPITPDPADCVANPIDIDRLVEFASTPVARSTPTTPLNTGVPTPDEIGAISDVVLGAVACTNANQPLRALSYFTEAYVLYRIGEEPAVVLGHLRAASTRNPDVAAPDDRVTITSLEAGPFGDGFAHMDVRSISGNQPSWVNLRMVSTSDGWKIDVALDVVID